MHSYECLLVIIYVLINFFSLSCIDSTLSTLEVSWHDSVLYRCSLIIIITIIFIYFLFYYYIIIMLIKCISVAGVVHTKSRDTATLLGLVKRQSAFTPIEDLKPRSDFELVFDQCQVCLISKLYSLMTFFHSVMQLRDFIISSVVYCRTGTRLGNFFKKIFDIWQKWSKA